ncbi:MAG TPA: hypothetical protein VNM49_06665 [Paenibacillus cookii]|nr:hypothetical protein [Paenibacillus cookii]
MSLAGYDLMNLVGQSVKINRGGHDSVEGVLQSVQNNYMAVWTNDSNVVYVNTQHIKSISSTGQSGDQSMTGTTMTSPIRAYSFGSLLQALRYRYVQVNRGGPEKLEGIVADANQNYLMLAVKGEEVVRIPIYHIKSVAVVSSNSNNKNNNNNNNNSNNNNQNSNNKSGGSQSGGNRSSGNRSGGNRSGGSRSGGSRSYGGSRSGGSRSYGSRSYGGRSSSRRSRGRSRGRSGGRK